LYSSSKKNGCKYVIELESRARRKVRCARTLAAPSYRIEWKTANKQPLKLKPADEDKQIVSDSIKAQLSNLSKWQEGDVGFTNRHFQVTNIREGETEMTVRWFLKDRVKMKDAFHADHISMTGEVESGAAQQIREIAQEAAVLSRIFNPIQLMLRGELHDRIQRSDSWEEKMKTSQNVAEEYRALKDDCDANEVDTLPKNFSDLWRVIVDSRGHKANFKNAARGVRGIHEWESLAYQYPSQRVLNDLPDAEDFLGLYKICEEYQTEFRTEMKKLKEVLKDAYPLPDGWTEKRNGLIFDRYYVRPCGFWQLWRPKTFKLQVAPLKGKARAIYKFIYKYGYNARRLTDVMRASIIFDDLDSIRVAAEVINEHFKDTGGIRNIKDRIASPPLSGYRDVLINVQFGPVMVEIQLHLRAFYELKHDMHATYKKARHFGSMFNQLCYHE